jgi:hypothetical protein
MGRIIQDETYRNAFNAAVAQRVQIFEEFERLKNRRVLVEAAAMALEPLVYPDEYLREASDQISTSVAEVSRPAPPAEIERPAPPVEITHPAPTPEQAASHRPVQTITQVYVRGNDEPENEIQRRIDIAIGRSAAD